MVKLVYILGVFVLLFAGGILGLSASCWLGEDGYIRKTQYKLDISQPFRANGSESGKPLAQPDPSLVMQAKSFASYLNSRQSPQNPPAHPADSSPSVPAIRPAAPSVKFRLCATSYYPNQPGRSMALIAELGSGRGSERWVREGAQVGHFVIHEIRRGAIVYRDGDNLREMAVERDASPPSIVRDLRPGSVRVSAAIGDTGGVISVPTGPNGIEISGDN